MYSSSKNVITITYQSITTNFLITFNRLSASKSRTIPNYIQRNLLIESTIISPIPNYPSFQRDVVHYSPHIAIIPDTVRSFPAVPDHPRTFPTRSSSRRQLPGGNNPGPQLSVTSRANRVATQVIRMVVVR